MLQLYKRGINFLEAMYLFKIREALRDEPRDLTDPWVSKEFERTIAGRPTYLTIADLVLYWRNEAEDLLCEAKDNTHLHPATRAAEIENRQRYLDAWDKLLGGPSWLKLTPRQRAARVDRWLSPRSANRLRNLRLELEEPRQLQAGEAYAAQPQGRRRPLFRRDRVAKVAGVEVGETDARDTADALNELVRRLDDEDTQAKKAYASRKMQRRASPHTSPE